MGREFQIQYVFDYSQTIFNKRPPRANTGMVIVMVPYFMYIPKVITVGTEAVETTSMM